MITLSTYVKKGSCETVYKHISGLHYGTQAPAETHHLPCCTELNGLFGGLQRLASHPSSRSNVAIGKNKGHTNNQYNKQSLFTKAPTEQAIYENAQHPNQYFNQGRYVSSQQSIHRMNNIASQEALACNTEQVKIRSLSPSPRIEQTISETNHVALPTTHIPEPPEIVKKKNLSSNL